MLTSSIASVREAITACHGKNKGSVFNDISHHLDDAEIFWTLSNMFVLFITKRLEKSPFFVNMQVTKSADDSNYFLFQTNHE